MNRTARYRTLWPLALCVATLVIPPRLGGEDWQECCPLPRYFGDYKLSAAKEFQFNSIGQAVISPDGSHVAVAGWGEVAVLESRSWVVTWRESEIFRDKPVSSVAFSQINHLATAYAGGNLVLFTPSPNGKWEKLWVYGARSDILGLAFSDDEKFLALALLDRSVQLLRLSDRVVALELNGFKGPIEQIGFADSDIMVAAGKDGLKSFDIVTGKLLHSFARGGGGFALSPDRQRLVVFDYESFLFSLIPSTFEARPIYCPYIDEPKGAVLGYKNTEFARVAAFVPRDGHYVFSTGGSDGTIRLWNLLGEQGSEKYFSSITKGTHNIIMSLAFAPDGRQLVSADAGGKLIVWDVLPQS